MYAESLKVKLENKKFTPAQQNHLKELIIGRNIAQQALDTFVGYLRAEHCSPEAEGWNIPNNLTGFERKPDEPTKGA